jgi:hypothetical protein
MLTHCPGLSINKLAMVLTVRSEIVPRTDLKSRGAISPLRLCTWLIASTATDCGGLMALKDISGWIGVVIR